MYPKFHRFGAALVCSLAAILMVVAVASAAASNPSNLVQGKAVARGVPILLYHRFGPVVADGMTIRTSVFEAHLRFLRDHGYSVVPLRTVVDWVRGKGPPPPPRSVVITADDGHRSVYTEMMPLVVRYHVPVTLFVYPSAISNASYAMTWEQLRQAHQTGLFDIQSHTLWHPNFKVEKRRLAPAAYAKLVETQLVKPKRIVKQRLGIGMDMLAWPFGIYDQQLIDAAMRAGYLAAFTIERGRAGPSDHPMTLPRYLLSDSDRGTAFARIVGGGLPDMQSNGAMPQDHEQSKPASPGISP
jgi:peptidoglycan/xylan/chitin deacetylase (PgdA/CDA1 family)